MAIRIDGAALAAGIKAQVRQEAAALPPPPARAVGLAAPWPNQTHWAPAASGPWSTGTTAVWWGPM